MPRILVALGSNLAGPSRVIPLAWQAVCARLGLSAARCSRVLLSDPAEGASGAAFCNAVGLGETDLGPHEALAELRRIERAFGRDRRHEGHHGARPLDLDLLDLGGVRLDDADLQLPHPRMAQRDFVLVPILEIAPEFIDVRSGLGVAALLAALRSHWITP